MQPSASMVSWDCSSRTLWLLNCTSSLSSCRLVVSCELHWSRQSKAHHLSANNKTICLQTTKPSACKQQSHLPANNKAVCLQTMKHVYGPSGGLLAGTVSDSKQHQVPALRAAPEPGSHPPPAAQPHCPASKHLQAWYHCWQQPPHVWSSPRRLWRQFQVPPQSATGLPSAEVSWPHCALPCKLVQTGSLLELVSFQV